MRAPELAQTNPILVSSSQSSAIKTNQDEASRILPSKANQRTKGMYGSPNKAKQVSKAKQNEQPHQTKQESKTDKGSKQITAM